MHKILIADDDERITKGLSTFFPWEKFGFTVVGMVKNGKEAIDFIHQHDVDVLICDIRMPDGNGFDVAQRLKDENRNIKVVFVTAYRDFSYAKRAIDLGVCGFITKPTQFNEIENVIKRLYDPPEKSGSVSGEEQRISRIVEYINRNLANVCLSDLALYLDMNPQYLSRYFRQEMHINFSDYLLKQRMEKAAFLLQNTTLKGYQISEYVGYANVQDFSRVFKKYYSLSPRDFRHGKTPNV